MHSNARLPRTAAIKPEESRWDADSGYRASDFGRRAYDVDGSVARLRPCSCTLGATPPRRRLRGRHRKDHAERILPGDLAFECICSMVLPTKQEENPWKT